MRKWILSTFMLLSSFSYAQPSITSFSPEAGSIGTTVIIKGKNFSSNAAQNIVYFGAVKATVSAATDSTLTVAVPAGASYQPVSVTNQQLTGYSNLPFKVTFTHGSASFRSRSFTNQLEIKTAGSSYSTAIADINGDGKSEVIAAFYDTQEILIFPNKSNKDSISLESGISYSAGTAPKIIKTADLDGDGLLDILIGDDKDKNLIIYKNTSSGGLMSLAPRQNFTLDNATLSFCIVDANKDGKPDLAVISSTGQLYIYKNISINGSIQFSKESVISPPGGGFLSDIAAVDINGDGNQDLAVLNRVSYNLTIWKNTGTNNNISFTTETIIPFASSPRSLAIGDVTGDNLPDFIISETDDNSVFVLRNKSKNGVISIDNTIYQYATSRFPELVIVNDLDGDGKTDIAASNWNAGSFSILKNLQSINDTVLYAPRVDYFVPNPTNDGIRNINSGDLDGDGFPEIISTSFGKKIGVFRNTLLQPLINSVTPTIASAGVPITIKGRNFIANTEVSINGKQLINTTLQNDSLLTGIIPISYSGFFVVKNRYGVDSAAFNYLMPTIDSIVPKIGIPGSAVTLYGNNFDSLAAKTIFFGAVPVTVQQSTSKKIIVTAPAAATYENITLTEKGNTIYSNVPFISVSTDSATNAVLLFQKNGTFITGGAQASDVKSKDLNGDGKPDFVVNNKSSGGFTIFKNTSQQDSISLAKMPELATAKNTLFTFGDLDGDGKPDLITVNDETIQSVIAYRNISSVDTIVFGPKITFGPLDDTYPVNLWDIFVQDLDGDGRPDIIVENSGVTKLSYFLNTTEFNTGNITMAKRADFETGSSPFAIRGLVISDINNDKKADLLIGNDDNSISILRNTSSISKVSFSSRTVIRTKTRNHKLALGDIDNDGAPDLVASFWNDSTLVILNNKSTADSIIFSNPTEITASNMPLQMYLSDMNGDGKPDIVSTIADSNSGRIAIFRNSSIPGKISFTSPATYIIDPSITVQNIFPVDLNADTKQEIIISNSASGIFIFKNLTNPSSITSFTPKDAGKGATVIIKGKRLSYVTQVFFGGNAASSFKLVSDTVISAIVGNGNSGFLSIATQYSKDSLPGFIYGLPIIKLHPTDTSFIFGVPKGKFAKVQSYGLSAKYLQGNLDITAPTNFQLAKSPDSTFTSSLSLPTQNGNIDSMRIYVRFKADTAALFTGQILHTSTAATTRAITVTGNSKCDSLLLLPPLINNIKTDTIICYKDSILLSPTSGPYISYLWNTGDTTKSIIVKGTSSFSLIVGSGIGCISLPSLAIKTNRNTNPIPSIAQVGNSNLVSSAAPKYRWLFNNTPVAGNTTNTLVPSKVGFYTVETSNDSICWDRSVDYPIITLNIPLVNDTLATKVYPNPTSTGLFYVVGTLQKVTNVVARVTVTDANGNILLQSSKFIFFGKEIKIPITLTSKGTVFVKLDMNGDVKTQTVILQ
jgi:hypothetical protein